MISHTTMSSPAPPSAQGGLHQRRTGEMDAIVQQQQEEEEQRRYEEEEQRCEEEQQAVEQGPPPRAPARDPRE
jgi:hypothetical protein